MTDLNPHLSDSKSEAFPIKLTHIKIWCCEEASNPRPFPYRGSALPTELSQHGASGRDRTADASLFRTPLYRLSYRSIFYAQRSCCMRNILLRLALCAILADGVGFEPTHPTKGLLFSRQLPLPRIFRLSHPIQLRATVLSRAFSPRINPPLPPSGTCHLQTDALQRACSLYTNLANLVPMVRFELTLNRV